MYKRIPLTLTILLLAACASPTASPTKQPITPTQILPILTQTTPPEPEFDPLVISQDNIDKLQQVDQFGKGTISDFDISPDGMIAAMSTSTGVYLYDMETLEATLISSPRMNYIMQVYQEAAAVAFSPDGQILAIAYDWIFFWDLEKETIVGSMKNINTDFRIDNMGFSHNGQQLITMGESKSYSPCDAWGGNFQVIDIPTETLLHHSFYCKQMSVQYFHTTSDGKVYLSAATTSPDYRGFETIILDASTGKVLEGFRSSFDERILSVNQSGSLYAFGSENGNDIVDGMTNNLAFRVEGRVIFLPETNNMLVANQEIGWHLEDLEGNVLCIFENDTHK